MRIIFVLLLLAVVSCSVGDADETADPSFCTLELRVGLVITVKDAKTNEILTEGITVKATSDSGTEILKLSDTSFIGAYEKAGNYSLTVEGEGYQTFISDEVIKVEEDACHVITESREVLLSPVE